MAEEEQEQDTVIPKLRSWNFEEKTDKVLFALAAPDGKFLAFQTNNNSLIALHCKITGEEEVFQETKGFIWGNSELDSENKLSTPTSNNYLIVLDKENSITIFEFLVGNSSSFSYSLVTIVGCSIIAAVKDIPPANDISLICSFSNNDGTKHKVLCLVNKQFIVEVLITASKEPQVGRYLAIYKEDDIGSNQIFSFKRKDNLIFFLSENLVLYIISILKFQPISKINLQERLLLYDVYLFDVTDGNVPTVVFLDESMQLHFIRLQGLCSKGEVTSNERNFPNIWKYRLNYVNKKQKSRLRRRRFAATSSDIVTVPPEFWMNDFKVNGMSAGSNAVIMLVESKIQEEERKCVVIYSITKNTFTCYNVLYDTCLCLSNSSLFPTLLVTSQSIAIALNGTSQEQLIDIVIQFSDIAQAEMICKSNNWDQFSIPLHTLQVGLQHRQLDTIAFFLKSRESVFTRYWKNIYGLSQSLNMSASPSKSFTSQKSYGEIDSDEMMDAIEMLMKAVNSCSKGKHKQNFFEGLIRVVISYLNNLIQDGVAALQLKSTNTGPDFFYNRSKSKSSTHISKSFNFLHDIPDSMKYITEKIINLRSYLKQKNIQKAIDDVDEVDSLSQPRTLQMAKLQEMLFSGKIASLQKILFSRAGICDGTFSEMMKFSLEVVEEQLKNYNITSAEKILLNIGLNPKEEIKSIYLKTLEKKLRRHLRQHLKKDNILTQQDIVDYSYVEEVEEIYSSQDFALVVQDHSYTWNTTSQESDERNQAYSRFSLQHLSNWDETTRRQILIEGKFIKDAIGSIKEKDNLHLWRFLLSRNNLPMLLSWLSSSSLSNHIGNISPVMDGFPALPEIMLTSEDRIPAYTKEALLKTLVRYGFYPQFLLTDIKLLAKYLCINNMLFGDRHPMESYKRNVDRDQRKRLTRDFNVQFLCFCEENDLVLLLWKFISHYRIDFESVLTTPEIKSWVAFLMSFHKIFDSKEINSPILYDAMVKNSRFLDSTMMNTESPVLLNEALTNKDGITALSIALVCNLSIDEILPSDSSTSVYAVEKALLQDSLRIYPKVYSALFSQNTSSNDVDKDVSIYRLIQDNTKLDVRHWFSWQPRNELAVKDENTLMEMPHFSNKFLVERYSLDVKLSFDYYLSQGRPMFAYLIYMKEFGTTLMKDSEREYIFNSTYKLAIENYNSKSIASSCVLFMELLEGPNNLLKVDIKTAMVISKYWNRRAINEKKCTPAEIKNLLVSLFLDKTQEKRLNILKLLEDSIEIAIYEAKDINRFSFEAVCQWELAVRFCQLQNLPLTTTYVTACCKENNWLQLVLFIHLYQMPQGQILEILNASMTNKSLMEHLIAVIKKSKGITLPKYADKMSKISRPIKENTLKPLRSSSIPDLVKIRDQQRDVRAQFYMRIGATVSSNDSKNSLITTSVVIPATSTPKKENDIEENKKNSEFTLESDVWNDTNLPDIDTIPDCIVDILLECSGHAVPWKKLLSYAVALYNPLLAVLSACYANSNPSDCLCIWYICSVSNDLKLKICQNLLDLQDDDALLILRSRRWLSGDLLIIFKCILSEGVKYTKLLSQGFVIFKKHNPLVFLPQFLEAFLYDCEKSRTLSLLTEFQSEYQAYRDRNVVGKSFATEHDLELCEEFSLQCLMLVLQQCKATYHAYKFVCYLADAKYGFMFDKHVPNFLLVKNTADIVYSTRIQFSVQNLCVTDIEYFEKEVLDIFEKLLDHGFFDEAYSLAKLHNLSESNITVQKCHHELKAISQTNSWHSASVRCTFWNQSNRNFNESKCSPDLASKFFEEQSELDDTIYIYDERAMLLLLAIKWHKDKVDVDFEKVYHLERQVWMFRIKAVKENKGPVDDAIMRSLLDYSVYESTFNGQIERKCSGVTLVKDIPITELLQNENVELFQNERSQKGFKLSDKKEEEAFELLIGNLLDKICITEARRVASYFKRTTADLEIIITSVLLAQGQLPVEKCSDDIKSILAETTSRHISVSGILEKSGSFTRPESLTKNFTGTSGVMVDFVFIEEVQNALEKLTLRVNYGKKCCQQILICFKIANILSTSYEEVVKEDCFSVLKRILETRIDHRRQLAKQFIRYFDLPIDEVSLFLGEMIISWIKVLVGVEELSIERSTLLSIDEKKPPSEEGIISLVQLADSSAQVGRCILEEAISVIKELTQTERSNALKLCCEVELLIYAHYCFTITCDMEGISGVLRTAQYCIKCLGKTKQYSVMVRLLTGIGRFREMFYVIETLYNEHHFEVLCRKGKGDSKENLLKMALLEFMKKYHPEDMDNLNMISLCFGMYREAAQHLEGRGRAEIERVKPLLFTGSREVVNTLEEIRKTFLYAADNYSKEECLYLKQSCTRLAHLTKLQIQLLPAGCQVLGLTTTQVQEFLNTHNDFIEALIVADSYNMRDPSIWTEPLYRLVVLKGVFGYLEQYQNFFQLTPQLVTKIAMRFRSDKSNQSPANMKKVLVRLRDVRTKMKIARELNFTDIEKQILDGPAGVYLRDHTF